MPLFFAIFVKYASTCIFEYNNNEYRNEHIEPTAILASDKKGLYHR